MKDSREGASARWLATPAHEVEAELRQALDQAAARQADEVTLRRVWARLAEIPALVPSGLGGQRGQGQDRGQDGWQQGGQDGEDRRETHPHALGRDARMSRVRWPWIVAASLAGATATLALMLVETKSEFRAERGGQPDLARPSGMTESGGIDAGQRSTLVAPATVRTGFGETLHLSLRGGTEVVVTSESTLVLDRNDHPAVSAGEVQFHVPHQAAGKTFEVTAGEYRIVVVGTRFRVRVSSVTSAVDVDEGLVEVWTDHRIAQVAAGGSWASPVRTPESGTDTGASSPGATGVGASHVGASRVNDGRGDSGAAKVPRLASTSKDRDPARSSHAIGMLGSSDVAAKSQTRVLALSEPSTGATFGAASGQAGARHGEDALLPAADETEPKVSFASPAPVSAGVPAPPLLALQARAARAGGDARRALGLYRILAERGGAAGENAEYEMGRVLRDGLHQSREAVSVWRAYRASHPHGLLRIEADISVIETLVSLGDRTGAAAEASEFIRRYPESERRSEIARLAGDLLREHGECGDAIRAYDIALARGHVGRDVADAVSFHRAVCLLHGDQTQGVAALRSYVDSFPSGRFRAEAQRLLNGAPFVESPAVAPR